MMASTRAAASIALCFAALLVGSSASVNFVYRSFYVYTLQSPTAANLAAVATALNATYHTVAHSPSAWRFGADLGISKTLGYNASNANFGGHVDFTTLAGLEGFYAEIGNNTNFKTVSSYLVANLTYRIQTVHPTGDVYNPKQTYYIALFAYQWNATVQYSYVANAFLVISNLAVLAPVAPNNIFLESDLGLHDTLYPTKPPNFQFSGIYTFLDIPTLTKYYPFTVNAPSRIALATHINLTFRLQFKFVGAPWTLPAKGR